VGSEGKALTFESLGRIKASLKAVYRELAFSPAARAELERMAATLLQQHGLEPAQFADQYLQPFEEAAG
jgi:hypothetical protein